MALAVWSWPTAYDIDSTTYIKDTDGHITNGLSDLADWVNSDGSYTTDGLSLSMVDLVSAQTVAGNKTFTGSTTTDSIAATTVSASAGFTGDITGDVTGDVTGDATNLTGLTTTVADLNKLTSGTYTPTATLHSGVSTATPVISKYSRVGNIVTVQTRATVTVTSKTSAAFSITLPIASNFTTATDATGTAVGISTLTDNNCNGYASADTGSDKIYIQLYATDTTIGYTVTITAMYEVK